MLLSLNVPTNSADEIDGEVFSATCEVFSKPHNWLSDSPRLHEDIVKAENVTCQAEPKQMAVDAFQFQNEGSDDPCPQRNFNARRFLNCLAVTC